jgi:uncharacterized UBP type Zn finger protein
MRIMKIAERLAEVARRAVFQRSLATKECGHLASVRSFTVASMSCPSCETEGSSWTKLRMCMTCGSIGCCDSSRLRHARSHFEATGHPVMRSIEPAETWAWCYPDEAFLSLPA